MLSLMQASDYKMQSQNEIFAKIKEVTMFDKIRSTAIQKFFNFKSLLLRNERCNLDGLAM